MTFGALSLQMSVNVNAPQDTSMSRQFHSYTREGNINVSVTVIMDFS